MTTEDNFIKDVYDTKQLPLAFFEPITRQAKVPGDIFDNASKTLLLTTQFLISISLGSVTLLTFCFLRTRWRSMFAPRLRLKRLAPDPLPPSFFGWIVPLYKIPESTVLNRVGLDAAVDPDDSHGDDPNVDNNFGNDPIELPVDNRPEPLPVLISYALFTWVFSIASYYFMFYNYREFSNVRHRYYLKWKETITSRTVMVTVIPKRIQTDRALAEFYDSLGFGPVESAVIYRYVRRLRHAINDRLKALKKLEMAYTEYLGNPCTDDDYDRDETLKAFEHAQTIDPSSTDEVTSAVLSPVGRNRPTMRTGLFGLFGKKVDKIEYYTEKFNEIDKMVQRGRRGAYHSSSVGFVTFENITSAQLAAQILIRPEPFQCQTTLAPEPRDIYWSNLTIRNREYLIRTIWVNIIVFFIVFLWSGPITFFASLLSLEALSKIFPWLANLANKNEMLKGLIQGTLPTLAVSLFNIVVPKIMIVLSKRQGFHARSVIEFSTFAKYYFFLLFNVLLAFTVAGAVFTTIQEIIDNPTGIAHKLATTLPQIASFFVNFVMIQGIGLFPAHLLQIKEVAVVIFKRLKAKTPRSYAYANVPPFLDYGEELPPMVLIFVIVLVYSSIAPIILPFVYFHPYETAGLAWPKIFRRITIGLYIYQIMMIGYLILKESYYLAVSVFPTLIMTAVFFYYVNTAYDRNAAYIPLKTLKDEEKKSTINTNDDVTFKQKTPDNDTTTTTDENSNAKDVLEDDLYHAEPDMYTDYSQPPMTLYKGVLNTGMRNYIAPALVGTLPWLWLPVKRPKVTKSTGWLRNKIGIFKKYSRKSNYGTSRSIDDVNDDSNDELINANLIEEDLSKQKEADSRIRENLYKTLQDPNNPHKAYYCRHDRDIQSGSRAAGGFRNLLGISSTNAKDPEERNK
ncbi:997_t:CDS:10 [Entrophospora sp. SA101]|nr:997_t:CDS:10 [Entrophospora sp. SA101]